MNRKIAALALVAATVLVGACGGDDAQSDASNETAPTEPTTTWSAQDLAVVEVAVTKPAPNAPKVDPATIPTELSNFVGVPGLSEQQQDCVNAALKTTVDSDPSLKATPGKQASLGAAAIATCDSSFVFTDPLIDGIATGESDPNTKLTTEQSTCFKQSFATDKKATAKMIASMMASSMGAGASPETTTEPIKESLAPFEQKCGVKISGSLTGS